jgi:hypothetical protein
MTNQTQKVAIVTGASGGIGAAVAERLARDGFTVVVNYAGNAASADAVVARIEDAGGRAVAAKADISDAAAVARMFDSAETAFGGVDVLINNAGIMNVASIKDSDDDLFERHIAVNLKGTFNTLREAARRLRDGGRIVNFWRLRRHQGSGRGDDQHSREGTAWTEHHRQRHRPGTDGDEAFSQRQTASGHRSFVGHGAPRASRPASGHRLRGGFPRRSRWRLDQRSDPTGERRDHLIQTANTARHQ